MQKLPIKISTGPAISINRDANRVEHLVYIAVANKKLKYRFGRSKVGYIGTTKKGAKRIASSAAYRSKELLALHGITSLDFFVVSCQRRQGVKTWKKLERALILTFRSVHGDIPKCNVQGRKYKWGDELDYFTEDRLRTVIDRYS